MYLLFMVFVDIIRAEDAFDNGIRFFLSKKTTQVDGSCR